MIPLPLPPRPVAFMLAALAALSVTAVLAVFPIGEADVFMYLAIGRRMVEQGGFVATDPFIYSIPNFRWEVLHEWLLHLAAYGTYKAFGFPGLVLAKAVVVTAMAAGPLLLAWRLGHL